MATKETAGETQIQLKSSFKYSQPSLPHLLTEYGFQDEAAEKRRKEKEAEKERRKAARKQKKKSSSFDDAETERALEKEKERDEQYLQLVRDMYRLRDYYYNEYNSLLTDKVQKQRKEMRERDMKRQKERELAEEEERKARHHVKKRLERHTLETTPMTGHVPKTDMYYIVGLEDKLRKEGKLKSISDYNKFREEIEDPRTFYTNFKVNKHMDFSKHSVSSLDHISNPSHGESADKVFPLIHGHGEDGGLRSLSRIDESQEGSRRGSRTDSWAITQQFQAQYKGRRSISGLPMSKPKPVDTQTDIDRRFPKLEMPKLHCFTMDLAKKPPDPEEVRLQEELRTKEKQRKKMVRTVTKMYQLAMSNSAVSARIMDQHEDMDMLLNGPDLCDVIADHHWMQAYGLREIEPGTYPPPEVLGWDMGQSGSEQPEQPAFLTEDAEEQTEQPSSEQEQESGSFTEGKADRSGSTTSSRQHSAGSKRSEGKSASRKSSRKSKRNSAIDENKPPLPLTQDEIVDKCKVMEAKTLSTMWNNYLRSGTSNWNRPQTRLSDHDEDSAE